MKPINWNAQKNRKLIEERDISFEDIVYSIQHDGLLNILEHPKKNRFPHQRIFIVNVNDYAFIVPFVEEEGITFLKTIIPSRKMTKKYLGGK